MLALRPEAARCGGSCRAGGFRAHLPVAPVVGRRRDRPGGRRRAPEDIENIRRLYGLDRPLVVQYLDWLGRMAAAISASRSISRLT